MAIVNPHKPIMLHQEVPRIPENQDQVDIENKTVKYFRYKSCYMKSRKYGEELNRKCKEIDKYT